MVLMESDHSRRWGAAFASIDNVTMLRTFSRFRFLIILGGQVRRVSCTGVDLAETCSRSNPLERALNKEEWTSEASNCPFGSSPSSSSSSSSQNLEFNASDRLCLFRISLLGSLININNLQSEKVSP